MARQVTPLRYPCVPWVGECDLGGLRVPVRTDRVELCSWAAPRLAGAAHNEPGSLSSDRVRLDMIGVQWVNAGAAGSIVLALRSSIACGPLTDVAVGTVGPAALPGLLVQVDGVLSSSWSLWGRVIPGAAAVEALLDVRALVAWCCVPYGILRGSLLP